MMEKRVELSPATSTTRAAVCTVLFLILISSDIQIKRYVLSYSNESIQMKILAKMLITLRNEVLEELIVHQLLNSSPLLS